MKCPWCHKESAATYAGAHFCDAGRYHIFEDKIRKRLSYNPVAFGTQSGTHRIKEKQEQAQLLVRMVPVPEAGESHTYYYCLTHQIFEDRTPGGAGRKAGWITNAHGTRKYGKSDDIAFLVDTRNDFCKVMAIGVRITHSKYRGKDMAVDEWPKLMAGPTATRALGALVQQYNFGPMNPLFPGPPTSVWLKAWAQLLLLENYVEHCGRLMLRPELCSDPESIMTCDLGVMFEKE